MGRDASRSAKRPATSATRKWRSWNRASATRSTRPASRSPISTTKRSPGSRIAAAAASLPGFWFPRSVVEADYVVSMPKMKTHHWMGVTASMKNLYGVLPGIVYGWPKNVLHQHGIPETVFDINASLPSLLAIVDGIDCMEGDGPIMGSLKPMGLIVVGTNLPAVDATVARIMGLPPERIPYLALAANHLGPLDEAQDHATRRSLARSRQSVQDPRRAPLAQDAGHGRTARHVGCVSGRGRERT